MLNRRLFLAGLMGLATPRDAFASLADYVARPETERKWSKTGEAQLGDVKVLNLTLRSQVWRGIPWDHPIQIFLPKKLTYPKTSLLLITGGRPSPTETLLGATVSPRLEAPAVILYGIPNQPLLGGKSEDDLIAHTFQEYLASGDPTWPLLFPMVKSAVAAMDAVQELSRQEWEAPVDDFILTGASKRGWTTYLTGAADKRARAIAPMVFDNLNFARQMPRQLELWGKYSEQIDDYTRRGLQAKLETPEGRKLVSMVDPWFYRDRLTMPKLLIHGANDRYWATDATRVYWDDLKGRKHLLAVPNGGHGLDDRDRVLNTLGAFFRAVAGGQPFPEIGARHSQADGKVRVRVESSVAPKEVRLWTVRAGDLDFRPQKWTATPLAADGAAFAGETEAPAAGGLAAFAEAAFEQDGRPYTLSTPCEVYGKR